METNAACFQPSKSNNFCEKKTTELKKEQFKKITCAIKSTLINFAELPLKQESINRIFFKDPDHFCLVHKANKISSWFRQESMQLNALICLPDSFKCSGMLYANRFIISCHDNEFTFFDARKLTVLSVIRAPLKLNHFLFEYGQDINTPDRLYISETSHYLRRWDFTGISVKYSQGFNTNFSAFFQIKSMALCKTGIVAACISYNTKEPLSSIKWFSKETGILLKSDFENKNAISSFTLVKNDKEEEKKIFILYETKSLFLHNFENKTTLTTTLSFFPEKTESLTLSPIGSYLFVYQSKSTSIFAIDQETLSPLYQFDLSEILKGESLVSFNAGHGEDFILTSQTKVLDCQIVLEEIEDRPAKMLKKE